MARIADIVRATGSVAAGAGGDRAEFGNALFLTVDDTLAVSGAGRARQHASLEELTTKSPRFTESSEPWKAAAAFFSQDPFPRGSFFVARWVKDQIGSRLLGTQPQAISANPKSAQLSLSIVPRAGGDPVTAELHANPVVTLSGGTPDSPAVVGAVTVNNNGEITGIALTSGGSGYDSAPVVTVEAGVGSGAQVTANVSSGSVSGLSIGNGGSGYEVGTNPLIIADSVTYSDMAAQIQTALRTVGAPWDGAVVTFDVLGNRFAVELPYSAGDFEAVAGGAQAAFFGLDDATFTDGAQAEDFSAAIAEIARHVRNFTFVGWDASIAQDVAALTSIDTWARADGTVQVIGDVAAPGATVTNESSSIGAVIAARQSRNTALAYRDPTEGIDYVGMSVAARYSAVNWSARQSLPDGKFIKGPGRRPDNLDRAERLELKRKRINFFTDFGVRNLFAEGQTCAPGYWLDTQIALLWMVDAVQADVFGAIADAVSARMTPYGISLAIDAASGVCDEAVRNGMLFPGGRVRTEVRNQIILATGNEAFDGVLPRGYLIHVDPVSSISAQDLAERIMPPMTIWCTGASAIHFANIGIVIDETGGDAPAAEEAAA